MLNRLRMALAILAAVLVGAFASTPPASATPRFNCYDSYICFYDGTLFGTWSWTQYNITIQINNGCENIPSPWNNAISSFIYNPTDYQHTSLDGYYLRFYMNANCTGTPVPIYAGDTENEDGDLTTTNWGNVSNAITSFEISHQ